MARRKSIVTSSQQVLDNIKAYQAAIESAEELQARLGRHPAWYAMRNGGGGWIFGPSKFVGYAGNDASYYLRSYDRMDGKETEPALKEWFTAVDPASDLGQELRARFSDFAAGFGKRANKRWRVSIQSGEKAVSVSGSSDADRLLERIVSNPGICGGRPSIRGTRVRVSDIVDMMGHGASVTEILADFPYIKSEDVRAALLYAARAMDHPVVRAA